MSKNEKKTENLARKLLTKAGIFGNDDFIVEEQKSDSPIIQKLLKSASKSGEGLGKPEFIIRKKGDNEFIIVIECKADTKFHESKNKDLWNDYAVDGALLYASHLSKGFTAVAIGISGEGEDNLKMSTYLYPKNSQTYTELRDENHQMIQKILNWDRYVDRVQFDPMLAKIRHTDLMKFSRELHEYLRDYAKVTEAQKPLLVSGILLALMEKGFEKAYITYEGEDLARKTFQAIQDVVSRAQLGANQESKKQAIINAFSFVEHHPELHKIDSKKNESPLKHIIQELHTHVKPFTQNHYDFDIIGNFYGEFIRYTGGDGKGLGIVLTPKHITDLFADLANLDKNSVVLDICAGTSSFLISAMKKMTEKVDADQKKNILENNLIGIEQEPQMFALAVSNMILRGDGKTNLYQGSCFDDSIFEKVKGKASAGFINPPYSQKGENLHEWNFILRMLEGLQKNATGIAIVPMSLATDTKHPLRERLLREHRLEAVMSMPDDLFSPVNTVTCIMVFTAHTPHDTNEHHETWFGYWKDDGFRKDKAQGRIPKSDELWNSIKKEWIEMYRRKEITGKSVWKKVSKDNEWCAEAYLETDYNRLIDDDFSEIIRDFVAFKILSNKRVSGNMGDSLVKDRFLLNVKGWRYFYLSDLFQKIEPTRGTTTNELVEGGDIPYIAAKKSINGLEMMCSESGNEQFISKGNGIVFIQLGAGSAGYTTYQEDDFIGMSGKTSCGYSDKINKYNALFLVTILDRERPKYSFGRSWTGERLVSTKIKLPTDKKGGPDWQFMEDYIKSLPYSANI